MDLTARPFEESIGERDLAEWRTPVGRWFARRVLAASRWTTWRWVMVVLLTVLALVAGVCVWLIGEVVEAIHEQTWARRLDEGLLQFSVRHRPGWAAESVTWFTHIGGTIGTPVIAALVLGGLAWRWRSWTPVVLGAIAAAGSLTMTLAGKAAFARARPPLQFAVPPYEHSFSFPSGHSMNAVVIAGVIAYVLATRAATKRRVALIAGLAALYALVMGVSRVYLGHHWLTDVIGGWIAGACWLGVVITAHRLQLTHHRYHEQVAAGEATSLDQAR